MAQSSSARVVGRPFVKGEAPGRLHGSVNKTTVSVKAALEAAFLGLGGVPALIAWGEREPAEFYRLWSKLLPRNVTIEGGAQLGIVILPPLGSLRRPLRRPLRRLLAPLRLLRRLSLP